MKHFDGSTASALSFNPMGFIHTKMNFHVFVNVLVLLMWANTKYRFIYI